MDDNWKKLFKKLEQFEPSEKLRDGILARIDFDKRRSAQMRLIFLGVIAITSLITIIPSFQYAVREFYQSGFYQYLSLIFSDGAVIMGSWKELTMSLAETIPAIEIVIFLGAVFTFLISTKLTIKNIEINYKLKLI